MQNSNKTKGRQSPVFPETSLVTPTQLLTKTTQDFFYENHKAN